MTFKQLYEEYHIMVYNLALQYVQQVEDAEEITQDVFVKVHGSLDRFRNESSLKTWIYRITINQSLDYLKSKKSRKWSWFHRALSIHNESHTEDLPHFNHPGVQLEQKEELEGIFHAINQLPDNQKTALILLKIQKYSQEEVCQIMNMKEKALESLFYRAKKNLEIFLQKQKGL